MARRTHINTQQVFNKDTLFHFVRWNLTKDTPLRGNLKKQQKGSRRQTCWLVDGLSLWQCSVWCGTVQEAAPLVGDGYCGAHTESYGNGGFPAGSCWSRPFQTKYPFCFRSWAKVTLPCFHLYLC